MCVVIIYYRNIQCAERFGLNVAASADVTENDGRRIPKFESTLIVLVE